MLRKRLRYRHFADRHGAPATHATGSPAGALFHALRIPECTRALPPEDGQKKKMRRGQEAKMPTKQEAKKKKSLLRRLNPGCGADLLTAAAAAALRALHYVRCRLAAWRRH